MSKRKTPYDPAVSAALGEPTPRAEPKRQRPKYASEERRTKATFDLAPETIEALRQIGARESRGPSRPSKVAAAFLKFAIDAYRDGRLALEFEHEGTTWQFVAVERES